jgi:tRNA-specific 2-thiouridylase
MSSQTPARRPTKNVMVMMSGGVDSSVAAALLRDAGHDVTGVTLKLWGGESDSGCCSVGDVEDARRVAAQLGIPHYVFNFSDAFDEHVVAPYVAAYEAGTTPNPCVDCNRTMKWGRAFERARQLGFDYVATGHHARIVATDEGPALARGADDAKDQSYVLALLQPEQFERTLLPVGELTKSEVRERAHALGLRTASKRESMDVCFITRGGREAFLGARIPRRPGRIVDTAGREVGTHDGVDAFTIGQRRGVNVAVGERRYVVDIDSGAAEVTVGPRAELLRGRVRVRDLRFSTRPPTEVLAQTRAHGPATPARINGDEIVFASPQPRVAPGQVVACYDGHICCGGGIAAA